MADNEYNNAPENEIEFTRQTYFQKEFWERVKSPTCFNCDPMLFEYQPKPIINNPVYLYALM
ncbi:hypothetical protein [Halostagnicola kamekurae]|uniref:hypothetical protein n=1 Tax=Halostagnicola kamekurae TaxID=619731 RepID=UPI001113E4C8|nr:hypothetical protein [Halostagnicola kamekurae]